MSVFLDYSITTATFMLVALGLFVVLGLMDIVNLAHTGFMAAAAYAVFNLSRVGLTFSLAVLLAIAISAALGFVGERLVVRRLYGRHIDDTILATWGLSLVLMHLITIVFGRATVALAMPISGNVVIGGVPIALYRLVVLGLVIAIVLALVAVMRLTRIGLVVRMVITNETLARAVGINTRQVRQTTFIVGAILAGTAGALLAPLQAINPSYAFGLMPSAFLIVLMSGRRLSGLILACLLMGLSQTVFAEYTNSVVASVMVILTAVLVLRLKPEGLVWARR